jgi:hypothetical protein
MRSPGPAIPLVQSESITALKPPNVLVVDCPAGCGVTLSVPVEVIDTPSVRSDDGESSGRYTAEAPELLDHIYKHFADLLVRTVTGQQGIWMSRLDRSAPDSVSPGRTNGPMVPPGPG